MEAAGRLHLSPHRAVKDYLYHMLGSGALPSCDGGGGGDGGLRGCRQYC
eukprot:COSAG02_NODE_842_length_16609_cov_117.586675_1_plen_49_part_00